MSQSHVDLAGYEGAPASERKDGDVKSMPPAPPVRPGSKLLDFTNFKNKAFIEFQIGKIDRVEPFGSEFEPEKFYQKKFGKLILKGISEEERTVLNIIFALAIRFNDFYTYEFILNQGKFLSDQADKVKGMVAKCYSLDGLYPQEITGRFLLRFEIRKKYKHESNMNAKSDFEELIKDATVPKSEPRPETPDPNQSLISAIERFEKYLRNCISSEDDLLDLKEACQNTGDPRFLIEMHTFDITLMYQCLIQLMQTIKQDPHYQPEWKTPHLFTVIKAGNKDEKLLSSMLDKLGCNTSGSLNKVYHFGRSIYQGNMTALSFTILERLKQSFNYLLEQKVDVPTSTKDKNGFSALGVAVDRSCHQDTYYLNHLLQHIKKYSPAQYETTVLDCLVHAIDWKNEEAVKFLVNQHPDLVNGIKDDLSPLSHAFNSKHHGIITFLLEKGAKLFNEHSCKPVSALIRYQIETLDQSYDHELSCEKYLIAFKESKENKYGFTNVWPDGTYLPFALISQHPSVETDEYNHLYFKGDRCVRIHRVLRIMFGGYEHMEQQLTNLMGPNGQSLLHYAVEKLDVDVTIVLNDFFAGKGIKNKDGLTVRQFICRPQFNFPIHLLPNLLQIVMDLNIYCKLPCKKEEFLDNLFNRMDEGFKHATLSPDYCDAVAKRLQELVERMKFHEEPDYTFDDLAASYGRVLDQVACSDAWVLCDKFINIKLFDVIIQKQTAYSCSAATTIRDTLRQQHFPVVLADEVASYLKFGLLPPPKEEQGSSPEKPQPQISILRK